MQETVKRMINAFAKQRIQRHRAMAGFTAMAIIVSMFTMYSLVQPAVTLENDYTCGLVEHIHTDECYEVTLKCALGDDTTQSTDTETENEPVSEPETSTEIPATVVETTEAQPAETPSAEAETSDVIAPMSNETTDEIEVTVESGPVPESMTVATEAPTEA
ncbi:MAG: hypothetical protein IJE55_05070, partial [Clostridia bacterium]|nr:hypothetical protein [Clostridia bacterium]